MKKLTKALKGTIKKLEVKDLQQMREMDTKTLNKHLADLNKCYDYEMNEDENETVETLINDINGILTSRLADNILAVADKKEDKKTAPKKTTEKTAKKTALKKESKEATKKDKKETAPTDKKEAPKATKADKPKAPTKKTAQKKDKPKTLKDVLKWKSLIKMTLDDNIHYCYVVDIETDFKDVLCRSTDMTSLVFQFDSEALENGVYTDPTGDQWKLEYTGKELK